MKIEFIDLRSRYKAEKKEIFKSLEKVIKKGHFVLTNELQEFEQKICNYTQRKYCLGLNSGTDALMMSLWSLGIGKGDEVITSPTSFIATVGAISHVGAKPVFVDVKDDFNLESIINTSQNESESNNNESSKDSSNLEESIIDIIKNN